MYDCDYSIKCNTNRGLFFPQNSKNASIKSEHYVINLHQCLLSVYYKRHAVCLEGLVKSPEAYWTLNQCRPHGLIFTCRDVAVYVFDINQPSLPTPYYCFGVCLCLHDPFNFILIPWILPTTLCFLTLFFQFYLCHTGPFNSMSLYNRISQP